MVAVGHNKDVLGHLVVLVPLEEGRDALDAGAVGSNKEGVVVLVEGVVRAVDHLLELVTADRLVVGLVHLELGLLGSAGVDAVGAHIAASERHELKDVLVVPGVRLLDEVVVGLGEGAGIGKTGLEGLVVDGAERVACGHGQQIALEEAGLIAAGLDVDLLLAGEQADGGVDGLGHGAVHDVGERKGVEARLVSATHDVDGRDGGTGLRDADDQDLVGTIGAGSRDVVLVKAGREARGGLDLAVALEQRGDVEGGVVAGAGAHEIDALEVVARHEVDEGVAEQGTLLIGVAQRVARVLDVAVHAGIVELGDHGTSRLVIDSSARVSCA